MKRQISKSKIIVRDFNTPLTAIVRATRQKIRQNIEKLNTTIIQESLIYIFVIVSQQQKNTFFQVPTKHSPSQVISWVKKQTSTNLEALKECKICSQSKRESD